VIEEINERESELNAAVGIAKMLMNKMTMAQDAAKYMDSDLEKAEFKIRALEGEVEKLMQMYETAEKENAATSKALEDLEQNTSELNQENKALQRKLVASKAKVKAKELAKRELLVQELDTVTAEKDALEEEFESKDYTERLNVTEKQLEEAEAGNARLEVRLQKAEDQHEVYRGEIEKLQMKVRLTEEEVGMKQDQVNLHLGKIKTLENKLTSVNREKDRLMT
jgi:chromosome segregation ATPase